MRSAYVGFDPTGFILSLLSIYSLFKFQRWPFANEGLLISLYGLLPIIAIVTFKFASSKKSFYSSLLISSIIGNYKNLPKS